MDGNQTAGLVFGIFIFTLLIGVAIGSARRNEGPEAPPISNQRAGRDKQSRGIRGMILGWGYGLILSPLVVLAVQPWAPVKLTLWQIALFGIVGVLVGARLFGGSVVGRSPGVTTELLTHPPGRLQDPQYAQHDDASRQ